MEENFVSKKDTLEDLPTKDLFEFISQEHSDSSDLGLFSLLPEAQSEDYEEEQFAKQMKKKKSYQRKR